MKVHLIDVDSTITNLALAKLSAWHKAQGDEVTLIRGLKDGLGKDTPDKAYVSVIYKKNREKVDILLDACRVDTSFMDAKVDIDVGGSGYDLKKELPPEVEAMKPDYSLYPENDYSIGFASRGCFRNCYFCVVPEKEGKFRRVAHPSEWYNPEYDKIVFLDNNILTDKEYFMELTDWCAEKNLSVWWTQGLDIRKLDEDIAGQLLKMKTYKSIFFAWDNIKDEAIIKEKIALLKSVGFTNSMCRAKVQFYCYVDNGSEEEYQSGLYRARELKKLSCNAFIMFNIDNEVPDNIRGLRRWANKKQLFWLIDIDEYKDEDYKEREAKYKAKKKAQLAADRIAKLTETTETLDSWL